MPPEVPQIITPEVVQAIGDQVLRVGKWLVVVVCLTVVLGKLFDALKVKWKG